MAISSATANLAFKQIDADRGGAVSLTEFRQGRGLAPQVLNQAIAAQGGGAVGAKAVFNGFDADKNGKLSGQEFADGLASLDKSGAAAVLAAQEQQNAAARLTDSLKTSLYASLGSKVGADGFTQQILAAYGIK